MSDDRAKYDEIMQVAERLDKAGAELALAFDAAAAHGIEIRESDRAFVGNRLTALHSQIERKAGSTLPPITGKLGPEATAVIAGTK